MKVQQSKDLTQFYNLTEYGLGYTKEGKERLMKNQKEKAVVLLSGGLDSTTALAIASKRDGYRCATLSFDYGQRHQVELHYAKVQSRIWDTFDHRVVTFSMDYIDEYDHNASLVNKRSNVPTKREINEMSDSIPSTYVPARNTIFLAHAAAYAEVIGASKIYVGVNELDYSGYPDCRPEYIDAYQTMLKFATKQGVEGNPIEIEAPLISLTKAEIILRGFELGVDYVMTNSCYNPNVVDTDNGLEAISCRVCDSCILRREGFKAVYDSYPEYQHLKDKNVR